MRHRAPCVPTWFAKPPHGLASSNGGAHARVATCQLLELSRQCVGGMLCTDCCEPALRRRVKLGKYQVSMAPVMGAAWGSMWQLTADNTGLEQVKE